MSQWAPVPGWEGRYEVSITGEVRSVSGKAVGQYSNSHGYMLVRLSKPRAELRVHRLVAMAFIENPDGKPFVNHINNDRSDNRRENLEWCTQVENIAHADRQGRMNRSYWVGKRTPVAALSDEQVCEIRRIRAEEGLSLQSIASKFGVSKRTFERVVKMRSYANVK